MIFSLPWVMTGDDRLDRRSEVGADVLSEWSSSPLDLGAARERIKELRKTSGLWKRNKAFGNFYFKNREAG